MNTKLRTPEERTCERCGREEYWDDADRVWRIVEEDGERLVGSAYCIHEWDITGEFSPIEVY
jgi:hypothetical protein